jgi:hypothetical protein
MCQNHWKSDKFIVRIKKKIAVRGGENTLVMQHALPRGEHLGANIHIFRQDFIIKNHFFIHQRGEFHQTLEQVPEHMYGSNLIQKSGINLKMQVINNRKLVSTI